MDAGRQWFLHAIYTVRSARNAGRGIGRRSVDTLHHAVVNPYSQLANQDSAVATRVKRDEKDVEGVGKGGRGTNIARVQLDLAVRDGDVNIGTNINTTTEVPLIPIIISIIVIIIVCILLIIFFVRRKRKRQTPPPSPTQTITVVANGQSRVHTTHAYKNDNTEV